MKNHQQSHNVKMNRKSVIEKKISKAAIAVITAMVSVASFAEVVTIKNEKLTSGTSSIAWSDNQAAQVMSDNRTASSNSQIPLYNDSNYQSKSPSGYYSYNNTKNNDARSSNSMPNFGSATPVSVNSNKTVSYNDTNYSGSPSVSAYGAIVMDAQTGKVLYNKNINSQRPIASVTKLMTAVVTAEAGLNMSEQITLQSVDFAGAGGKNSSSRLKVGDTFNRAEVLLLALMKSENPAAAALARTYPGGRSAFVNAMNAKARQLGMNSSYFTESTGLDKRNVSTPHDLAILVSAASQYGVIRQFSTTASHTFNSGYRTVSANNTNAIVRNGTWNLNISKTGYISEAGRCVVMSANINQRPVIIVLLGAPTSEARTNDANRLLSWVSRGISAL